MAIPSIITNGFIKTLSGLGNNSDSIVPMAVKDIISDCTLIHTYKKEGDKDDVREKTIEEFGTGALWLFGIPIIKKIIDKTIYPALSLNPDLDPRILNNKNGRFDFLKSVAKDGEKKVFDSLSQKTKLFNKFELPFSNYKAYKGVYAFKFLISTVSCAFALTKLIKYKQKTTDERIKKDLAKNKDNSRYVQSFANKENLYSAFLDKTKKKNISFGNAFALKTGDFMKDFVFNPVKNTSILDACIAGTRLKESRRGEKLEVLLKELFQIMFIYVIAKPIQKAFEAMGRALKLPIELDPNVIFDANIKDKLNASKKDIETLMNSKNLLKSIYELESSSSLVELLSKNGVLPVIKDKNGIQAISTFKEIDENAVKKALKNLEDLSGAISSIKKIKAFKTFAVVGNVALAICAMGVLQPKITIWMRKKLNNGDNRNPAIVQREKEMGKVNS